MVFILEPNVPFEHNGVYYKIGLHGKVYKLIDDHWITSNITVEELNRAYNGYVRRGLSL